MSREVELLGQVIADLQASIETERERSERLSERHSKDIEELKSSANQFTFQITKDLAKSWQECRGLRQENERLRSAINRAIAELRLRIKDQAEFDGVFNALNRISQ